MQKKIKSDINTFDCLIGIDEAGRGPLAGPVSVGLVIIPKENVRKVYSALKSIKGKDSKKLSEQAREMWFQQIKIWKQEKILDFHVALISAKIIDTKGISFAIKSAIKECLKKMKADPMKCQVLLDGSLKAPEEFKNQKTIIKGDEKELIIGLASISAKVTRDAYMHELPKKYQKYGFLRHVGYGTKAHRQAIIEFGPSDLHRISFLKNIHTPEHPASSTRHPSYKIRGESANKLK